MIFLLIRVCSTNFMNENEETEELRKVAMGQFEKSMQLRNHFLSGNGEKTAEENFLNI